jgi:Zn-dependent protease with chaperone function
VECVRFRRASLVLLLFLLTISNAAVGKRNNPKLAETIDLPPTFDIDFKLGALQRGQIGSQVSQVPDDVAGRVGADVFQSLVRTQMISGIGLPYAWTFKLYDAPVVNAYSIPDGEIVAYTGISRLLGSNRGLWAAVLAHEMAHVARRHAVRKYMFHEYIEEQVRYWQLRAQLGDKYAGWTAVAVRVAGSG